MPWEEARAFCRRNYTDLVAIQNKGEIEYLNKTLPFSRTYYFGLESGEVEGVWTWVGTNKSLTEEAKTGLKGSPTTGRVRRTVWKSISEDQRLGKWSDDACQSKEGPLLHR